MHRLVLAPERRGNGVGLAIMITVLEGSTFCICDDRGDVTGETSGLFADDTRFLSRFVLTIDGERPLLLSSGKVEYFSAAFYLRNPLSDGLAHDVLSIARSRFVGDAMQERISIRNESMEPQQFEVGLELGSDFADIFAVKNHDFALGDPVHAKPLPPPVQAEWDDEGLVVSFADDGGDTTQVLFSRPSEQGRWRVELAPRSRWEVVVDVFPHGDGFAHEHAGRREAARMESLEKRLLAKLGYPDPYASAPG